MWLVLAYKAAYWANAGRAIQHVLPTRLMLARLLSITCVQVDCPVGYTGPVTVDYASPSVQAVSYNVVDSLLLVKVTASSATQQ